MRKIFKALTERDHAAALEMNAEWMLKQAISAGVNSSAVMTLPVARLLGLHTEALAFNEQFDFFNNPGWQRQLVAKAHREARK
jgi:hypothetical protein